MKRGGRTKPPPAEPSLALRAKASRIAALLALRYPETPVPLDHTDAFTLLVAVVLSAQCTDARVNLVTPALFAAAPNPAALAALTVPQIQAYIATCGLAPTKAKNLSALAKQLVADHGGAVPQAMDALEALPGVGHKTASVVVSQAFGRPAFPVDTHIFRLARRWGLSDGKDVEAVEADLKALYPPEQWRDLHLRIIFFGRELCPARGHDPAGCPICAWAGVAEADGAELLPVDGPRPGIDEGDRGSVRGGEAP